MRKMPIDHGINSVRRDRGGISLWLEAEPIPPKERGGARI